MIPIPTLFATRISFHPRPVRRENVCPKCLSKNVVVCNHFCYADRTADARGREA
jgi:hypothetical protein